MRTEKQAEVVRFAHVGHRVVAAGGSDAQKLHMGVSLHGLKDLLQRRDGNVLQQQTN